MNINILSTVKKVAERLRTLGDGNGHGHGTKNKNVNYTVKISKKNRFFF